MRHRLTATLLALLAVPVVVTVACGGAATTTAPRPAPAAAPTARPASPGSYSPPADHVKDRKGAMHKKGSHQAAVNCSECHGADLRGGKGPSCYTCHDKEWR